MGRFSGSSEEDDDDNDDNNDDIEKEEAKAVRASGRIRTGGRRAA